MLDLIRDKLVLVGLVAQDPRGVIEELIDFLVGEGALDASSRDAALSAAFVREKLRPTGTECGVALPHATTSVVEDEIAAIGISREGVPFDGLDGVPARIIILVLTPPRLATGRVHTLSRIAALVRDEKLRCAILAAPDREAAVALLAEAASRLPPDNSGASHP